MTLPEIVRRNFALKLASVLLGVVIYLHVYTDQVHDGEFWLPVDYVRQPDSLAVMSDAPEKALVLLRGRGKELIKLKWRSPEVEVDLGAATAGRFYHSLGTDDVRMPATSDASAVAIIEPRLLVLEFDRVSVRALPARVRFTGSLPPGYVLRGFSTQPSEVILRGPSRLLPGADTLEVGPIDLRGFRGRARGLFAVRRPHPELVPEPPEVEVEVAAERAATREIEGVPVAVVTDSGLAAVATPESAAVRLEGLPERVEALAPGGLRISLDARGLGPGEHVVRAGVDTLAGVVIKPLEVRYQVRVRLAEAGTEGAGATEPAGQTGASGDEGAPTGDGGMVTVRD